MSITNSVKQAAVAAATVAIVAGGVAVAASSETAVASPQTSASAKLSSIEDDCDDRDSPYWPCGEADATPAPTLPTPAQTAPVRGLLNLTKQAYINVTDKSTVETVEATGTLLPPHQNLPVGTEVCFVYTLTNGGQSRPPWSGIWVDELRDFDTRLGDNGVIAKPGYLTSPQKYHACTTVIYLIAKP